MAGRKSAKDKLCALIDVFRDAKGSGIEGGCPIVNLAIESDDADPELRSAARQAMSRLIGLFERIVNEGIASEEFARQNARDTAVQMVATLEGGLIVSNLYKDQGYMRSVAGCLEAHVRAGLRA